MVAAGTSTPTLDHGRCDQKSDLARRELRHHAIFFSAAHLAMHKANLVAEPRLEAFEARFGVGEIDRLGFLHQRADPVDKFSGRQRPADGVHDFAETAIRHRAGIDRLPSRRLLAQLRDVHVAEISQHQRARDRRGTQHQHIDATAFGGQRQALAHAKTMLLVDHGERQCLEHHVILDQRVGTDQEIDLATRQPRQDIAPLLALFASGEDRDPQARAFGQWRNGLDVLARKNFRRRHQRRLLAGLGHRGGSQQRHHGLARSDVALQQPQHADRLAQIVGDGGGGLPLRGGQRIGQRVDDLVAETAVAGMAVAGRAAQLRADQRSAS